MGKSDDIPHLVQKHDIGLIAFAIHKISPEERQRLFTICGRTKARIVTIPDILGTLNIVLKPRRNREDTTQSLNYGYGEENPICQVCKGRFLQPGIRLAFRAGQICKIGGTEKPSGAGEKFTIGITNNGKL